MLPAMREYHLDLNHPAFVFDPYPVLAELRANLPVFFDPVWHKVFFSRYDDIAALLRDRRLGRSTSTSCPATSWAGRHPTRS